LHKFDAAFGGARRDEEKSRAKERVYSFRDQFHVWDPKNQRPELWNLYNGKVNKGESIRVFPLSNWTELDVWQYVHLEKIPLPDLYFAKMRPVVERDGNLIMVDDDRMPLKPGEKRDMPVVFYIDPAMAKDTDGAGASSITLSYTFYPQRDPPRPVAGNASAARPGAI